MKDEQGREVIYTFSRDWFPDWIKSIMFERLKTQWNARNAAIRYLAKKGDLHCQMSEEMGLVDLK